MKSRMGQFLLVAALIVPFAGCPGSTGIRLGEWEFEIDGDGTLYQLVLEAGGGVSIPADATAIFFGSLVWQQAETTFSMTQQHSGDVWLYTSTMLSRTSMEGTYTGPGAGTWTATFVK
jgi:hypothetical protein